MRYLTEMALGVQENKMGKPVRKNFKDIPDDLKCHCIGIEPRDEIFDGAIVVDMSIIQLGYVCIKCGLYADEKVELYKQSIVKRLKEIQKVKRERAEQNGHWKRI